MKHLLHKLLSLINKYKLIPYVVLLLFLDYYLETKVQLGYGKDIYGKIVSPEEGRLAGIRSLFLNFPLISLILATIVSIFPIKQLSVKEKLLKSFLIILMSIYIIMLILEVLVLIRNNH